MSAPTAGNVELLELLLDELLELPEPPALSLLVLLELLELLLSSSSSSHPQLVNIETARAAAMTNAAIFFNLIVVLSPCNDVLIPQGSGLQRRPLYTESLY